MPLKLRDAAGLTLVEMMIALAVAGVVAFVGMTVHKNFQQSKSLVDGQAELEDFKLVLRTNLRCRETLAGIAAPCSKGKAVALLGPAGKALIPLKGRMVRDYKLEARCTGPSQKEWDVTFVNTKTPGAKPRALFVPPLGCL